MDEEQTLIKDIVPPDEEITKTQLWNRIDYTRSLIEQKQMDLDVSLEGTVIKMQTLIQKSLDDLIDENNRIKKALIVGFKDEVEEIRQRQDTLKNTIEGIAKANEARIDRKMKEFDNAAQSLVQDLSSDLYADVVLSVRKLREDFQTLKDDVGKSTAAYQIEARSKFATLDAKLEKVLSTLRNFLKEL